MKELVEVKKGKVFCDSQMVADKFEHKHLYIVNTIHKLIAKNKRIKGSTLLPLNFEEIDREYRGQTFKVFLMDRRAFTLLAMEFKGDKAYRWRESFIDAFFKMEQYILDEQKNKKDAVWVTQREQGKLIRLTAMDTVKTFVDYATAQGSENAKFYYKHITVACYRCLQLIETKMPKLRDTLDLLELNQLMMAEVVAERSILKHMADGEHYKTIFTLVKQDLEKFADGLILPKIVEQKQIEGKPS